MIFNEPNHIELIRNGLLSIAPCKPILIKTQTRRPKMGIYKVGISYAVQRKRGVKAEPDIRIVMDRIWLETREIVRTNHFLECMATKIGEGILYVRDTPISIEDAWAEGGYLPSEFEKLYSKIYPKGGNTRWAFKFHPVKVEGNNKND